MLFARELPLLAFQPLAFRGEVEWPDRKTVCVVCVGQLKPAHTFADKDYLTNICNLVLIHPHISKISYLSILSAVLSIEFIGSLSVVTDNTNHEERREYVDTELREATYHVEEGFCISQNISQRSELMSVYRDIMGIGYRTYDNHDGLDE